TPILGLVVRRDLEIENFKPKPFYEVLAHIQTQQQDFFKAKWQPSEACEPYQNEQGRVIVKAQAQNVVERITDKPARVDKLTTNIVKHLIIFLTPFYLHNICLPIRLICCLYQIHAEVAVSAFKQYLSVPVGSHPCKASYKDY